MRLFLVILVSTFSIVSKAQRMSCDQLNIQLNNEITGTCFNQVITMTHDKLDRPYLYLANKTSGLMIYSLNQKDPRLISQIAIDSLDQLDVMGVNQYGSYLYLALGDFFSGKQNSAMAIIDVKNPAKPFIAGFWKHSSATEGSSMVLVDGHYAFLTGFSHGLFILDIADKSNIKLVSKFTPDLQYPDAKPDATKINARGMAFENDIVYLCYDAGGLRIINVTDKASPKETGRYSNPILNGKPRAYNNVIKMDSLLYIGVDYCGLEILNVADTSNIREVSWWNPWDCHEGGLKWFNSPGHVNEVRLDTIEMKLFLSTGKSDLHVVDVSDPMNPDSCSIYGGVENTIGTWGVNLHNHEIYLSYICTLIPFASNWSGVKILQYNRTNSVGPVQKGQGKLIFPNPISRGSKLHIRTADKGGYLIITNLIGECVYRLTTSSSSIRIDLNPGAYTLRLVNDQNVIVLPLVVID